MLAPLPINLLQAPPEIAETLDQWGIRKFGELAALPPLGIAARMGHEGTRLWQLARGEYDRLLHAALDPLRFAEELELEDTVESAGAAVLHSFPHAARHLRPFEPVFPARPLRSGSA